MQSGYYSSIGAMVTQFNKLDTVTNNLANLNTAGFKQDKNIVGDFMNLYQEKRDILPLENNTVEGSKFYNRTMDRVPQIVEQYTDYGQGAIKQTDNPLDLAIKSEHNFFLVQSGDKVQLSRNGAFSVNEDGFLINKNGDFVLSSEKNKIAIEASSSLNIDADGLLYQDNQLSSRLFVASVDNTKALTKAGNGNFDLNKQKTYHNDTSGLIASGYLEQSNVNPIYSMSQLIVTNRLLEMSQKAANSQMDDMNNDAINKVASTK